MKYFSEYPDVQRKLHQELLTALNDSPESRPLTFADISGSDTPYLEATVHEILRLARVAVVSSRQRERGPQTPALALTTNGLL